MAELVVDLLLEWSAGTVETDQIENSLKRDIRREYQSLAEDYRRTLSTHKLLDVAQVSQTGQSRHHDVAWQENTLCESAGQGHGMSGLVSLIGMPWTASAR